MTSPHSTIRNEATATDRLDDGLTRLGISLSPTIRQRLLRYLDLLAKWNQVYNLTSVRDPRDMLTVHLLDSLSILPLLDRHLPSTLLDVGSGAGLPGIPVAIARPSMGVTTIDAVAKKISFQQQCKTDLGIANLVPIHGRVEALTLDNGPALVVSRAYASIQAMLDSIEHLVGDDTIVIAMKGAPPLDELRAVSAPWMVTGVEPLDVPFLGAQRCAVIVRRS